MADLNDDYIKKFGDEASLLADKNYIVGLLKEIHAEYLKVSKLKIDISGSSSSPKVIKDAKDLDAALTSTKKKKEDLVVASNVLITSQEQVSRALAEEAVQGKKTGDVITDLQKQELEQIASAQAYYNEKKKLTGLGEETATALKGEAIALKETSIFLTENRLALDANQKAQKAYKAALQEANISEQQRGKYTQQLSILVQEEQEYKERIAASTKELRIQNEVASSIPNTGAGLKAQNKNLALEKDNTSDPKRIEAINAQIKENNRLLAAQKVSVDSVARAVIPMGASYKRALDIIEKEIAEVNAQLAAGGLSSQRMKELTARQQVLNNVLLNTGKEFSNTTTQSNAFKQSAIQLGQVTGKNDGVFKAFNKEVGLGNLELAKTEKQVARASSGSSTLARGFRSIGAAAVNLARLLPGIGIVGLIGGAVAGLVFLYKSLTGGMSDAAKAAAAQKEAFASAKDEYVKATIEVSNLEIAFEQARKGVIKKEEAIKLYNDTMGKTTGAVTTLEEAEQKLIDNGDDYIKMTLLKAAAQFALGKAAEKAFEAEENRQKKSKEFASGGKEAKILTGSSSGFGGGGYDPREAARLAKLDEIEREKRRQKAIAENKKDEDMLKGIAKKFIEDAKALELDFNAIKEPKGPKGPKAPKTPKVKAIEDETDEILAAYEAQLQAILEAERIKLQAESDAQLKIFENGKKSYDERAAALLAFKQKEQQIIDNENKQAESKLKADEAKKLAAAKTAPLKEAVKAEFKAKFDLQAVKYAQETNKLVIQVDDMGTELILENREKINKANKEAFDNYIKTLEKFAEIDQVKTLNAQLEKLKALEADFGSGKIKNLEDYQKRKEELLKEFDRAELQAAIDLEFKKLAIAVFSSQDTVAIQKKIVLLKKQQYELDGKNFEEEEAKKIKKAQDISRKLKDAIRAGVDFGKSLIDSMYERERQELEKLGDEIDRRRDRELAANDAIVQSQAERERKAAIINARAAADKAALDRRQKAADLAKARLDRAVAIAEVVANTARAVTQDLAGKKWLIPFDLAIGAAQLGAILARPLPKFRHGLHKDYEGPGIVGDARKKEVKIKKDGSFKITPATDTLEWFEKGDRVHPDADQFMREFHNSTNQDIKKGAPVIKMDTSNREMNKKMDKQNSLLERIANKREVEIKGTGAGYEALWKIGRNRVSYFNDKTNWR